MAVRRVHQHYLSISAATIDAARRSRLLFQQALGKDIKVGIISVPNPDYDSRHWWRYSAGVKEVSSETIAYVYAKFLFYPSESSRGEKAFAGDFANSKP